MKWVAALLLSLFTLVACGVGGTDVHHYEIPTLNGKQGAFDFAAYDPRAHLFFAADRADKGIDVFNASQPELKFLRTVALGTEPHGLTLAPDLGKLYAGNSDGTIAVIDITATADSFLKVLTKINTKATKGIDLLGYDPRDHKLYAAAPDTATLYVVDPAKDKVLKTLILKKGIEEPVYNPGDGMLYVAVNPTNTLYKIDPVRDVVVSETSLGTPCGPYGLAINQKTQQAMISCDRITLLWDLRHEKVIRTFGEVGAGDQVLYDPQSDRFFVPGINQQSIVAIFGGSPVRFYNSVQTHSDSKAIAYDPVNRVVFQPDAKKGQSGAVTFVVPDPEPDGGALWLPALYLLGLVAFGAGVWYLGKRKAEERRRLGRPMFS